MTTEDDFAEERANLYQRIGHLETLNARMTLARDEAGMNALALQVARQIEDMFVHFQGGRDARLESAKSVVREAIRIVLAGEQHWKYHVIAIPRELAHT